MANCQAVYDFLGQVSNRQVTGSLPAPDLAQLQQFGLLKVLSKDEFDALTAQVATLGDAQAKIRGEVADRAARAAQLSADQERTHSILFHLEGSAHKASDLERTEQERQALVAEDQDLAQRERAFGELLAGRSVVDAATPYNTGYVALTGFGLLQYRDLRVRLYRASDREFAAYWKQTTDIESELATTGQRSAEYFAPLRQALATSDGSYLWSIAVGLARQTANVPEGVAKFVTAYTGVGKLAHNDENRMMSAEILTGVAQPLDSGLPDLAQLEKTVRKSGVPSASSLGVATILFYGRRADGTFATPNLDFFLRVSPSYEAAGLLAIVNRPVDDLSAKFTAWRAKFASWGFSRSDDVELASAYLTVSELPVAGADTKLAIIVRGMAGYLQYPLVSAAILASVPIFEANETLNWLEKAYEVIGQRAAPLSQAELICLAVRMVHGIDSSTISELDATPKVIPPPPGLAHLGGPGFFFVPILVAHGAYYSTFSGISGAHPGHIHAVGGFSG